MGQATRLTMPRYGRTRPGDSCSAATADPACDVRSSRVMPLSPGSTRPADSAGTTSARSSSPARVDWRLMFGVSRQDHVLVIGEDASELTDRLAPWVGRVRGLRDLGASVTEPVDWVIFEGPLRDPGAATQSIAHALTLLRPGGRVVVYFDNLLGLGGWLRSSHAQPGAEGVPCRGLAHALRLMASAGCTEMTGYAALPDCRAARTLIPLAPPGPPVAEKFALGQAWKRATPARALGRRVLHLLIHLRLLRRFYPHYLVVGRKPC